MLKSKHQTLYDHAQNIAGKIQKDVEHQLNHKFNTFLVQESIIPPIDTEEQILYRLRVKTDNDGEVCLVTSQHKDSSQWHTTVETFHEGKHPSGIGEAERPINK